jgi:hippurate hydrolase
VRALLEDRIREVVTHQAASCGVRAEINYERLVPAICNHPEATIQAQHAVGNVLGKQNVLQLPPSTQMGSEDFAWMLASKPGCYFALGNGDGEWVGCSLHNDHYDFNDALIPIGAACWVELAQAYLRPDE